MVLIFVKSSFFKKHEIYFLKFVTVLVNEKSEEMVEKLEDLMNFMVLKLISCEQIEKVNFWNANFANNLFQNALNFIRQSNWSIQHAGIVVLKSLIHVGKMSVAKRFLKNNILIEIESILAPILNDLSELKAIQGKEKREKKNKTGTYQILETKNKEKEEILVKLEDRTLLAVHAIDILAMLHTNSREVQDGLKTSALIEILERFYSHPGVQVQKLILQIFEEIRNFFPEEFIQTLDQLSKIVVFCFNSVKKRNFGLEEVNFVNFFHFVLTIAKENFIELFESSQKIFSKLLSNLSVD